MEEIVKLLEEKDFKRFDFIESLYVGVDDKLSFKNPNNTYVVIGLKNNFLNVDVFNSDWKSNEKIESDWIEYSINFSQPIDDLSFWKKFFLSFK